MRIETRYCSYCKKQTAHEQREDHGDYRCLKCSSTNMNIQGFHMDLM